MDAGEAWRYRDWVVNATNRDLPYDQFVRDQVAGDVLPGRGPGGIVATGLLAIGNWGGGDADKEKLLTDIADDQVDVVSRTVLGLTVACARCHDHKFDPISTRNYYGLAGIFFHPHPGQCRPQDEWPAHDPRPAGNGKWPQAARAVSRSNRGNKATGRRDPAGRGPAAGRQSAARGGTVRSGGPRVRGSAGRALSETVADFASREKLQAFAVRQWLARLGLGDDRPFDVPMRNVAGRAGVHGWRGPGDTPNLLVNTTTKPQTLGTLTLPPRSLAIHPGPASGAVLAWRAPVDATVHVRGRLADADPVCGDGVLWSVSHRTATGRTELAAGKFANGGAQALTDGDRPAALDAVTIRSGDALEVMVLPGPTHSCDTTLVELTIATTDGAYVWDATRDLLAEPLAGNPHADAAGRPGVWRAADAAGRERADGDPFLIRSAADEVALAAADRFALANLRIELAALEKSVEPVTFANAAQEGGVPGSPHSGVHDVRIHVRGDYRRLGDTVPRHFPTILAGEHQPAITAGSGRRELAEWLTRPDNPLTARVMINRLWQHHFGEGMVRTPSNFGALGERPTHPELLDWLADQFMTSGWSMKAMHRLLMLSATYRQSSVPSADALQSDPDNRLWGRMNRHRLESEAIRDALVAVAGTLDRTPGGLAVRDFAAPRRTLYLRTVRSDRSGFGPLFDAADPTAHVDRRTVSTVAPQALFLMNHPFIKELARTLAERLLKERADEVGRIALAYEILYSRLPTSAEAQVGRDFLHGLSTEKAWTDYCHLLMCANETTFVD